MHTKNSASIKVFGVGEINIKPNQALITIGAKTEGRDLSVIQRENTTIIKKIISQYISLGLKPSQIQTADYRIEPIYEYKDDVQLLKGYKVIHLLQVKNKELDKIGRLIDTAVENGANTVTNIQFSVENNQLIYKQALQKAIIDSQFKAFSAAERLGTRIYPIPYLIEEEKADQEHSLGRLMTFDATAESTPIQLGLQTVSAKIKAEYFYY